MYVYASVVYHTYPLLMIIREKKNFTKYEVGKVSPGITPDDETAIYTECSACVSTPGRSDMLPGRRW